MQWTLFTHMYVYSEVFVKINVFVMKCDFIAIIIMLELKLILSCNLNLKSYHSNSVTPKTDAALHL